MAKGIIFDVDGTLIDSVDLHAKAWQEIFSRYGVEVPFPEVRSQIGKGGDQLMPVFLPPELVESKGEEIQKERGEHFKRTYLRTIRPFPGVRQLFERLRADGKRVVLASSGTEEEVAAYKEIAGVADLLESETSSDDAERSKPHPDIFLAALDKLDGLTREDVVIVGDTPYDAEAATKAGVRCIGVLCGGFPEADLRKSGCSVIFRDPVQLGERYAEWT